MVSILYLISKGLFKIGYRIKKPSKIYFSLDSLLLFERSFSRFFIGVSLSSDSDLVIKEDLEYTYILLASRIKLFEIELKYIKTFF